MWYEYLDLNIEEQIKIRTYYVEIEFLEELESIIREKREKMEHDFNLEYKDLILKSWNISIPILQHEKEIRKRSDV